MKARATIPRFGPANSVIGGIYTAQTDTWKAILAPSADWQARRGSHTVWDGKKVVIYGGDTLTAPTRSFLFYSPDKDEWTENTDIKFPFFDDFFGVSLMFWNGNSVGVFGTIKISPSSDSFPPGAFQGFLFNPMLKGMQE